jgi:hypothetical protein
VAARRADGGGIPAPSHSPLHHPLRGRSPSPSKLGEELAEGPVRLGIVRGELVHDVTAVTDEVPSVRWPYPPGDQLIAQLDVLRPGDVILSGTPPQGVGPVAPGDVMWLEMDGPLEGMEPAAK